MTLAHYLHATGQTQAEFAALIGATQSAISQYVRGESLPRARVLKRIQDVTKGQVTPNDFLAAFKVAS